MSCDRCADLGVFGCKATREFPDGTTLSAIPNNNGAICHDCGALRGHFHHEGCDMEECPKCGDQLAFCECLGGKDEKDEELEVQLEAQNERIVGHLEEVFGEKDPTRRAEGFSTLYNSVIRRFLG